MKLLSPYTTWRERLVTWLQIALLLSVPLTVHWIFWSGEGIDAAGRGLTTEQWRAIHEAPAQAEADTPSPGWVGLAE